MTIFEIRPLSCPHCQSTYVESYGDSMRTAPYSDGEPVTLHGDRFIPALICHACERPIFTGEGTVVPSAEAGSAINSPKRARLPNALEAIAIANGKTDQPQLERSLRRFSWLLDNDRWIYEQEIEQIKCSREGTQYVPPKTAHMSEDAARNLARLIDLSNRSNVLERIEIADIQRTLGDFEKALESIGDLEDLHGEICRETGQDSDQFVVMHWMSRAHACRNLSLHSISAVFPLSEALLLGNDRES